MGISRIYQTSPIIAAPYHDGSANHIQLCKCEFFRGVQPLLEPLHALTKSLVLHDEVAHAENKLFVGNLCLSGTRRIEFTEGDKCTQLFLFLLTPLAQSFVYFRIWSTETVECLVMSRISQ